VIVTQAPPTRFFEFQSSTVSSAGFTKPICVPRFSNISDTFAIVLTSLTALVLARPAVRYILIEQVHQEQEQFRDRPLYAFRSHQQERGLLGIEVPRGDLGQSHLIEILCRFQQNLHQPTADGAHFRPDSWLRLAPAAGGMHQIRGIFQTTDPDSNLPFTSRLPKQWRLKCPQHHYRTRHSYQIQTVPRSPK
jgi:hypothetical protein